MAEISGRGTIRTANEIPRENGQEVSAIKGGTDRLAIHRLIGKPSFYMLLVFLFDSRASYIDRSSL